MGRRAPHAAFVVEPILGHLTHLHNLRAAASATDVLRATFVDIPFAVHGKAARVPGYGSNWTVRSGALAWRELRGLHRRDPVDIVFFHTQVPAVLGRYALRGVPSVVSLDATPSQLDRLGSQYDHTVHNRRAEALKHRVNERTFASARHLVTWSSWARSGLVEEYGVSSETVTVIPPGVQIERFERVGSAGHGEAVRVLFVGGDLTRKGGSDLLEAVHRLRQRSSMPPIEVHLVTKADVPPERGVTVHRGLKPHDDALADLYRTADVFCLPTHGDCLPMVLAEAGAAGLPLLSTAVGAIPEIVRNGETGYLVEPGDVDALTDRLGALVASPSLRRDLGGEALHVVRATHDADRNAGQLFGLLAALATRNVASADQPA